MFTFRILAGLPAYGDPAIISFPKLNAFRKGLVVEFTANTGEQWIGNFSAGYRKELNSVNAEPDGRFVVVVAGGIGYFIDAQAKQLISQFDVEGLWYLDDQRMFLVTNGLWFETFDVNGVHWRSRRISWDGMQRLKLVGFIRTRPAY